MNVNGAVPMAGMNANTGGPVGGAQMNQMSQQRDSNLVQLHTYMYDHLLNMRHYDLAREFLKVCEINKGPVDQQNGDADSKKANGKPPDLPEAHVPARVGNTSFLQEWWATFWDFYAAAHRKSQNPNVTGFFNQNTACALSLPHYASTNLSSSLIQNSVIRIRLPCLKAEAQCELDQARCQMVLRTP
jgi:hypothetical protein